MFFGDSIQQARKDYRCDYCGYMICAGDRYSRHVWMPVRGIVHVMRSHETPSCPDPEDSEELAVDQSFPLALAA
jgi:hypothetical protein